MVAPNGRQDEPASHCSIRPVQGRQDMSCFLPEIIALYVCHSLSFIAIIITRYIIICDKVLRV